MSAHCVCCLCVELSLFFNLSLSLALSFTLNHLHTIATLSDDELKYIDVEKSIIFLPCFASKSAMVFRYLFHVRDFLLYCSVYLIDGIQPQKCCETIIIQFGVA